MGRVMTRTLVVAAPDPDTASPAVVLRAMLATDFMAFVEYTFGVVRPGATFKPNWHIEAIAHKLAQVASGEVKRLIITSAAPQSEVDLRIRRPARLVPWP